ncbi:MAG TPA: tetratricopeptide repeat protein, partial [Thermoplasmata archaeon]|nr:tetratricopeptide repeat protein [Thermoplasmata archaeon]
NEELFSKVTEQEARILTLASVFRYPAPADALYALEDVDPATLESLVEQSLLREVSTKVFDVHDIVRSFFVEMSSPRDRKRFHRLAAQHYLSIAESDPLEALYHLVEAADTTGAARLAVKEGRGILRSGHSEELLRRLDTLLPTVEDPGHSAELRLLKAHALNFRGELDQAVALYGEILQLPADAALQPKIAEAHRSLGDVLRREGRAPAAEEHFDAALRLYRTLERSEGEAETLLSMGTLAEDRADFPRAERLYERAINLSQARGMRLLEAEAQFAFSRILGARGALDGALDRKRRALAIAEGLADWHLQARFDISTGATLYELRRYDEAMVAYEHGIDTARRIGDLRMLAYGLYNAAGAYIRQDELLRAESFLKEAETLFRKLREPLMDALLLSYFGALWEKRGKWGIAKQNLSASLSKLREGGHDFDYARVAVTAADLFHRNGETETATSLLEDAITVGKRLRATGLVEEAQQDLVRLAPSSKDRRDGKNTPGPTATS